MEHSLGPHLIAKLTTALGAVKPPLTSEPWHEVALGTLGPLLVLLCLMVSWLMLRRWYAYKRQDKKDRDRAAGKLINCSAALYRQLKVRYWNRLHSRAITSQSVYSSAVYSYSVAILIAFCSLVLLVVYSPSDASNLTRVAWLELWCFVVMIFCFDAAHFANRNWVTLRAIAEVGRQAIVLAAASCSTSARVADYFNLLKTMHDRRDNEAVPPRPLHVALAKEFRECLGRAKAAETLDDHHGSKKASRRLVLAFKAAFRKIFGPVLRFRYWLYCKVGIASKDSCSERILHKAIALFRESPAYRAAVVSAGPDREDDDLFADVAAFYYSRRIARQESWFSASADRTFQSQEIRQDWLFGLFAVGFISVIVKVGMYSDFVPYSSVVSTGLTALLLAITGVAGCMAAAYLNSNSRSLAHKYRLQVNLINSVRVEHSIPSPAVVNETKEINATMSAKKAKEILEAMEDFEDVMLDELQDWISITSRDHLEIGV